MRVLIVRPEPGNGVTADAVRAMGHEPVCVPLFEIAPVAWDAADPAGFDAVAMTSASAARLGGAGLALYRHLPLFAVGEATAAAARDAGFERIIAGGRDAIELGAMLQKPLSFRGGVGVGQTAPDSNNLVDESIPHPNPSPKGEGLKVVHFAGEDFRPIPTRASVTVRCVYAARPLAPVLPLDADVALVHSPRAGERLAALVENRNALKIIAISENAARACGIGWRDMIVSPAPRDDAMLACLARLCEAGGVQPESPVA
ncbi:MAG: uroporphyrinogen-III synthase [Pseudomonadota bacterium]